MYSFPPLDCLPIFEAAARHDSFVGAAEELGVTPAAVGYRVRLLERSLRAPLFTRLPQGGVCLNPRGRAYLDDVQRLLADLRTATDRSREPAPRRRLRIVSLEGHAESWLLPRLPAFTAAHPDIALRLDTQYGAVDPDAGAFDLWLTCVATQPPQLHRLPNTRVRDIVFEEALIPVCSPALLQARGRPATPAALLDWPLLSHLGWEADWPYWFACQGVAAPDLSQATGFRTYGMLVQAAAQGLGVGVGTTGVLAEDLARGRLVPLFGADAAIGFRYCLFIAKHARTRPEVRDFRAWLLDAAGRADRGPLLGDVSL